MEEMLNKIRSRRAFMGLSQENMADSLGLTTTGYHKIESGKTKLTLERLFQLSKILDIPVFEFLQAASKKYTNSKTTKGKEKIAEEDPSGYRRLYDDAIKRENIANEREKELLKDKAFLQLQLEKCQEQLVRCQGQLDGVGSRKKTPKK